MAKDFYNGAEHQKAKEEGRTETYQITITLDVEGTSEKEARAYVNERLHEGAMKRVESWSDR